MLALIVSDVFSRDLWWVAGCDRGAWMPEVVAKSILGDTDRRPSAAELGVASSNTNKSMVFVNFCLRPRHDRQATSDAADVCC